MPKKDDRRIQRTRKALRDALRSLVLDRGYDDLSVQDITDKANLGRATFYLHYREKDELLEDLLREFSQSFAQRQGSKISFSDRKVVQSMFEYAEDYYDFYRIMAIGKGGMIGMRKMQAIIRETYAQFLDTIETASGGKFTVPRAFLDNFMASSLMSTIFLWLDQDMPYTPTEMADMFLKLASPARLPFSRSIEESVSEKQNPKNKKERKSKSAEVEQTVVDFYPQIDAGEANVIREVGESEEKGS
jgi:AcrR family transcriptional regulator